MVSLSPQIGLVHLRGLISGDVGGKVTETILEVTVYSEASGLWCSQEKAPSALWRATSRGTKSIHSLSSLSLAYDIRLSC